jgi:hypothetical protein
MKNDMLSTVFRWKPPTFRNLIPFINNKNMVALRNYAFKCRALRSSMVTGLRKISRLLGGNCLIKMKFELSDDSGIIILS